MSKLKPDINTKFHIDFKWWEEKGLDFRIYLWAQLCPHCQEVYTTHRGTEEVDWVDQETAEVKRVDGLWHSLRTCCSRRPDYITGETPLTTAVFRTFLANDNTPLSPVELHRIVNKRTPEVILRTLAGHRVYKGIKPIMDGFL